MEDRTTDTPTAEADEERLRRALRLIGTEAGRGTAGRPSRSVRWRSPASITGALVAAAAVVVGVLVIGPGIGGDSAEPGGAGRGQTLAEAIACSSFIAEGDVVRVRDAGTPGRIVVTFDVQSRIKPAQGRERVRLELADPAVVDPQEALRAGEHVLLMVQQRPDEAPAVARGEEIADQRSRIERELPRARATECPPYWRENGPAEAPPVPGDA